MDGSLKKFKDNTLLNQFIKIRKKTNHLISSLHPEDVVIQTKDFVSPIKWHLGHTTWFFENFLLVPYLKGYKIFDNEFNFIFNSYYNSVGPFNSREKRGYLNRPLLEEVLKYREYIDEKISKLLTSNNSLNFLIEIGINHEEQHQELILMDIKNIFYSNPLRPSYSEVNSVNEFSENHNNEFVVEKIKVFEYGFSAETFCYDNEMPKGTSSIDPLKLTNYVSNDEWRNFIDDGGYDSHEYWLSDGWDYIKKNNITRPLYWLDNNHHFTLNGVKKIESALPVSHISFYEACAYAKYKKLRLPSELEIEYLLKLQSKKGNLLEQNNFMEVSYKNSTYSNALYGNLWLWTSSNYAPYKNYKPYKKELMEYNSKFMCNQFVLKGGSFATPKNHIRSSYRNFYYPHNRWQFSGLRLVEDLL